MSNKKTIILDYGHRRDTPGKRTGGFLEWEFNQELGRMLLNKLTELGHKVEVTYDSILHPYDEMTKQGRTYNLKFRVRCANEVGTAKDSIFISIHANAHSDPKASGYEIYIPNAGKGGNSERLAAYIIQGAKEHLGVGSKIKNRGMKIADFYVIKHTSMPAVLIEHGFYTNLEERELLETKEFKEDAVKSIVEGINNYLDQPKITYDFLSEELPTGDTIYFMNRKNKIKSEYGQLKAFDKKIRYIKADPYNIGIITGYNNVKSTGFCGINGTFFWGKNHNGIIVIEDTIISEYSSRYWSPDGVHYPQSVLCYYRDGSFGVEKVKTAHEISKRVWWALGGVGLVSEYGYDPDSEGFKKVYSEKEDKWYDFSDVLRKCNHSSIAITEENEVVLMRSYNVYRKETIEHGKAFKCKYLVGYDSGKSCQIVTPAFKRPSWIAEKVSNMVVVTDL